MSRTFVIIVLLVAAAQSRADLDDGLITWFPLDGNTQDVSGQDHHGSIVGTVVPAMDRFGWSNHACRFSGSASYISVPPFALPDTRAFTLSAWVRPEYGSPYNDYRIFTFKFGVSQISMGLIQTHPPETSLRRFLTYFHTSAHNALDADVLVEFDDWVLCTTTYDSTTLRSFVNGEFVGEANMAQTTGLTAPLFIGGTPEGVYFRGAIDDARIYNRALSAREIIALANAGPSSELNISPVCRIGFSNIENDPRDVRVFQQSETLHVTVEDVDLDGENAALKAVLVGQAARTKKGASRGKIRVTVNLQRQADGSFTGSIPLQRFAPGDIAVLISGSAGNSISLGRWSTIRITP